MKRCPTCQRTFTDDSQKFCANDGTPLVDEETPAFDPEATVMSLGSQLGEEPSSPASPPSSPPPPYYNPGSGAGSQSEQQIHQSLPTPSPSPTPSPGASPAWPPATPPQQQPYYPQSGMPGGQPAPQQWQGGQQQPGWQPGQQPGQPAPGQNWGGGYYPQPGQQYPPYAAQGATTGKSKVALAALILGIVAFVCYAAVFIIVGARMRDLYDLRAPLAWLSLATGAAGLILGILGLVMSKTSSSKVKAGIGLVLSVIPLLLILIGLSRML